MSSNDDNDQFGQLTSDFIDNKNNIYKTRGTFIHLIKNINTSTTQVNDILNNQIFEISNNYFKKVEFSDLPNDLQQLIAPQQHKKKRSVTTLFSKFRTSKSSKSTTTTTSSSTTPSNNTNSNSNNNNQFNNVIGKSNNNTGSNTSLLDNTLSNNSSNTSNTIKLTTFDDNSSSHNESNEDVEDDIDSDEDDIVFKDRTNSFSINSNSNPLININKGSSSTRLNSLVSPPLASDLPSLDLPPPLSPNSTSNSGNGNNDSSMMVSPKIKLNEQQKENISIKLLKYFHKKQFKEYINKSPQVRQARLRRAALSEILTTEQTYFNSLLTCKQLFMDPLLNEAQTKKKPTLTINDINDIFGELPNIMQASQLLMNDLKKEIDRWPTHPILIGNIFKSFAPFFRMYSKYINNFDSVTEKVEKLEKTSKSFSQFLTKTHEMPECCGLTFLSYLVCPVQRVPRIRMLLQEVIRRTDETHVDYQLLQQALLIVNQVAENLNESKRIAENDKIVFELQEKLKGRFTNLLQPYRKFITNFTNVHIESSKEIEKKRLYGFYNIYLFNDMLLIVPENLTSNNSSNNFNYSNSSGSGGNSSNNNSNDYSNDSSSFIEDEERYRIARESLAIYLAFSKVKDKSEDRNDIESTSPSIQLLKLSSITSNSIGKYTFIMNSFIKTQQVKLTFSFNSQLNRDELESEIILNIEQLDKKNEKLIGKTKLKIENKRLEHVKLIKSNDMILSKNLLQKHVNSEKLKEISDRLITCELELEVKLQYYKNYKDEYVKQTEKLEQLSQKESESLIEYEEQVQKIIQIDDTIFKMLNHDIDAFRELFMDDPRSLIDLNSSNFLDFDSQSPLSFTSSSLSTSLNGGNNGSGNSLNSMSSGGNGSDNQSNSGGSGSGNRNTITSFESMDNDNQSNNNIRKQTILPMRRTPMFSSAAAFNIGLLDGSASSNRDSSLPLKQLKDTCNPYIQQAYKDLRRRNNTTSSTSSTSNQEDEEEEVEVLNSLYRIRPNRKWFMMEPIKRLPNKYSIDRLLHGENTPQDVIPKIYPYPEEYNDLDLYYDKISHRDGFYNEEEEEMFNNHNHDDDEFKLLNRNYSNYFDLPSNVDELRAMIIKLQFEKEDLKSEVSKLKQLQQQNTSTPSTPYSAVSSSAFNSNDSFNSLPPLTTSTSSNNNMYSNNNTITSPNSINSQPQQSMEYVASDFIEEYSE